MVKVLTTAAKMTS